MRILVVEDDPAVRDAVRRALEVNGYRVDTSGDGRQALSTAVDGTFDALVLDVMLPHMDGLEVCRQLRAVGDALPILMLTARDTVADRVAGLDAGADDYLVKPFALQELLARLRAITRRAGGDEHAAAAREVFRFGDLCLDTGGRLASRGERRLQLTRTEFVLLEFLIRHPRQVMTRRAILEQVWGFDFGAGSNALGVYIGYLRRKLEEAGEPRLIHTVRGVGYVLREE